MLGTVLPATSTTYCCVHSINDDDDQWRNSLLTRVDKIQGLKGPRGPQVLLVKICVTKLRHTHILLESSDSGNRA